MKKVVAFSILCCLVFLNVPRSLVHDCDHAHQHDNNGQTSVHFENEDCFLCEFDLDLFEGFDFIGAPFAKFTNYTVVESKFDYSNPTDFRAFSHRGPPTV